MRQDFEHQISVPLAAADALTRAGGELAQRLDGFRTLPRAGNRIAFARRRWGREFALSAAGGVFGGALESLGGVGAVAGWGTEIEAVLWNSSERVLLTATDHPGGSTLHVSGRGGDQTRQIVAHVVGGLTTAAAPTTNGACVRCQAPSAELLWCSACGSILDQNRIDPALPSPITGAIRRYKQLMQSGSTATFFNVFTPTVTITYPEDGRTLTGAQLKCGLERQLPVLRDGTLTLNAIFADGDSYWVAWELQHPRATRTRFVEHVRLDEAGRISAAIVHYL